MTFVGRSDEAERLTGLLNDFSAGRSRQLVIEGIAGQGKTELLSWVRSTALGRGHLVTGAAGSQLSSDQEPGKNLELAYWALRAVLQPLLGHLEDMDPREQRTLRRALNPVSGEVTADDVDGGTFELLRVASQAKPLLVLIDDVQWLDDSSFRPLVLAAHRFVDARVGFVFAKRPDPSTPRRGLRFEKLTLGGLTRQDAHELLSPTIPVTKVIDKLWQLTGGNPLTLIHNAAQLTAEQRTDRAPLPPLASAPEDLVNEYAVRFLALRLPTRVAVGIAALELGNEVGVVDETLAQLGGSKKDLFPGEKAKLIQLKRNKIVWRHPIVRSAICQVLTNQERRRLHSALSEPVRAASRDDRYEQAVWHLAESEIGPNPNIVAQLVNVAEQAAGRGALRSAATAWQSAAEFATDDEQKMYLVKAAELRFYCGDHDIAAASLEDLLARGQDPIVRGLIAERLGQAEIWTRGTTRATERFIHHASELREQAPDLAALLLLHAIAARLLALDPTGAAALACDATAITEAGNDPDVKEAAKALQILTKAFDGSRIDLKDLEDLETKAMEALVHERPAADAIVQMCGWVRLLRGDQHEADRLFSAVIDVTKSSGKVGRGVLARILRAENTWRAGRTADASNEINETLTDQEATGLQPWIPCTLAFLARMEAASGKDAECLAHADEAIALGAHLRLHQVEAWGLSARGLLALGRREWEEAHDAFQRLAVLAKNVREPGWLWWQADAIEAAYRCDRLTEANQAFVDLRRQAAETQRAWALAAVKRTAALLHPDDDPDRELTDAINLFQAQNCPFEKGRTYLARAEHRRGWGRRSEAAKDASAAVSIFRELRADPWVAQADQLLRSPARSVVTELDSALLPIAIALAQTGKPDKALAAQLKMNPKTLQAKLSEIRNKLHVSNRSEIVIAVREDPALRHHFTGEYRSSDSGSLGGHRGASGIG